MKITKANRKGPDGKRSFRWVLEVEVSETWVEDGFDLTEARAHDIFARVLDCATTNEFSTRVKAAPAPEDLNVAQGYHPQHERKR